MEFKSAARWDLGEDRPNKALEDSIVKTVAGFLNTDGGTLLIGIGPDRQVVGLDHHYGRVKPPNGDGFVNWLTTHLAKAVGHAAVMRSRAHALLNLNTLPQRCLTSSSTGASAEEDAGHSSPGLTLS